MLEALPVNSSQTPLRKLDNNALILLIVPCIIHHYIAFVIAFDLTYTKSILSKQFFNMYTKYRIFLFQLIG